MNQEPIEEQTVEATPSDATMDPSSTSPSGVRTKRMKTAILVSAVLVVGLVGAMGYQKYQELKELQRQQQQEAERLAHLDTESLNLSLIIDTVDDLGGMDRQLHWKEITAIAAAQTKNYPEQIDETLLTEIAQRFIIDEDPKVLDFQSVVESYLQPVPEDPTLMEGLSRKEVKALTQERNQILEANEQFKTHVTQYLEDLTYVGYKPERLLPDSDQMRFIHQIQEVAIENYHQYGILPSITIAQAILESSWGNSQLATEGNNLFGVKVGYHWTGETIAIETREFYDTYITDQFRKYDNPEQSIRDHAQFLVENPRYAQAGVFDQKTYRTQAQALENAGYSTDQDEQGNLVYADKLIEIISLYNLQLLDHEVLHPEN